MNVKVDISAWKYAVISSPPRAAVIALTNDRVLALNMRSALHSVVGTEEIRAHKINGYVGKDHASKGYIGYLYS